MNTDATSRLYEAIDQNSLAKVLLAMDPKDTALFKATWEKTYYPHSKQIRKIYQLLLDLGATK